MRMIWMVVLVAACDASGASVPFDPSAVQSGTYALTVTTQNDNCTPARQQYKDVPVDVQADPKGLVLRVARVYPGSMSIDAFTLPAADGYAVRFPSDGQRVDPCPGSGDAVVYTRTLVGADATTIVVDEDQSWQIVAACALPVEVPTASCHASRTLTYVKQ